MSTVNPKISQRAAQLALSTFPQYKGIRVDVDTDGKLLYVDPVTGASSNDRDIILNDRRTLGLVDYRLFNPGVGGNALRNIGTSQGALQLDSEVMVVNQFLRGASTDPIKAQRLRNLGLGHMIGEEITGELYKFNTRGQRGAIRQIQLLGIDKAAAASSQTDEGFTFLTLKRKSGELSPMQASYLRIVSGAEQIRPQFLATLAEETIDPITGEVSQNWSKIGKLAKRLQSTMSPRNVAIGEEFIQQHLDITRPGIMTPFGRMPDTTIDFGQRMIRVESTAARFELMFRDPTKGIPIRESDGLVLTPQQISEYNERIVGFEEIPNYQLTQAERQLLSAGPDEGDIAQGLTGNDSVKDLWDRRLTIRRNREMQSFKDLYGFDDTQIAKIQTAFDQANIELDDPLNVSLIEGTRAERQFQLMKDKIKATDSDLFEKMEVAINGMEKARDGQFYITPQLLEDMEKGFQSQLDARGAELRAQGRVLTLDESNEIKALEKQIEHIQSAKKKIDSGDVIARVNGEFGQFKGEAMVLGHKQAERFRDAETGLIPYVIGDATAIKGEVGSRAARNFLMDVGDTSTVTFTDPLMMLYHGEYFTQPAMIASIKQNASYSFDKMQEFMKTGNVPDDVMKALRKDIEGDIKTIEAFMLDPQTRMSHLIKKREAEEIMAQMASGIRVNQIPAMVRRVSDHYSSQVVRYKDGRVDAVMPTAGRYSLRTLESRINYGEDFMSYQGYDINLADYGVDTSVTTPYGRMPGSTKGIKTAGFRIKDKTLMMSGDAAYLYQHALGGFDLDDKGIPLMSTFKDANNKKRLAFFTLRQPTSYQEYIAMSADLSDASTVNALFKENDQFIAALQDDTVLSALGIRKDGTYEQLKTMVTEKQGGSVKRNEVNKDQIEQIILKILESGNVYPGGLPSLTDSQVVRMAMMQNPAALGLDRMVKDASGNLTPLGNFMQSVGIDPSKSPAPYDSDSVFQIFQKAAQKEYNTELIRRAPEEIGFSIKDSEHISQILKGTGPGYKAEDNVKLTALMKKMIEEIMAESASTEIGDSIGVFVNRQGASISVLEQSKKILTQELNISTSDPLYEKFLEMTSIMTLPASEAVDIAKQIGADQVMYSFGPALQMIQETQGIKRSTVDAVLAAYVQSLKNPLSSPFAGGMTPEELNKLDIPMQLDPMGQSSLKAFSGVGYIRGRQMAEQIAKSGSINEEELFGLQRTMFEEDFGYGRIKAQDVSLVKEEIAIGLEAAMEGLPLGPARDAIQASIGAMRSESKALESLDPMFMRRGTAAYDKYAHIDQMIYSLFDIHSASEAIKSQSLSAARLTARDLSATSYAKYQDTVEKILGSVSTSLSEIQSKSEKILRGGEVADPLGLKILRNETLTTIHGHVSAAIEAERVAGRPTGTNDVLDLMETLTAGLESRGVQAGKLLTSAVTTGEEGDPGVSTMLDLFAAMRNRKIARASMARTDMQAVLTAQAAYEVGGSASELRNVAGEILGERLGSSSPLGPVPVPISTDLAKMTTDEAQAIIDAGRRIRKSGKRDLNEAETIIGDFAGRVKALAEGADLADRVDSPEAQNAFMYHIAGRGVLEQADQRASEAVTGFLAGDQIPTAARDAIATSIDSARTTFSSGAVYKRFTESLKTGALGDVLKNKGVRTGLVAAGALSIFGFVKSHRRDHSPDDASGPPLLPGGSAYESGYPTRQAVIENLRTLNPLTRGMQYKVYTSGSSEDAEKLRSMVGGVTDGEVNSTMYSSLPLLGQDTYSQVASQF